MPILTGCQHHGLQSPCYHCYDKLHQERNFNVMKLFSQNQILKQLLYLIRHGDHVTPRSPATSCVHGIQIDAFVEDKRNILCPLLSSWTFRYCSSFLFLDTHSLHHAGVANFKIQPCSVLPLLQSLPLSGCYLITLPLTVHVICSDMPAVTLCSALSFTFWIFNKKISIFMSLMKS